MFDYTWSANGYSSTGAAQLNESAAVAAIDSGALSIFEDHPEAPPDFSPYLLSRPYVPTTRTLLGDLSASVTKPLRIGTTALDLTARLERRVNRYDAYQEFSFAENLQIEEVIPQRLHNVTSASLEGALPLWRVKGDASDYNRFEMLAAVRWDEHKVRGAAPRFILNDADDDTDRLDTQHYRSTDVFGGLSLRPTEYLQIRSSYATAFSAPSVTQIVSDLPTIATPSDLRDRERGDELIGGTISYVTGGNGMLKPEESTIRSLGFVLDPCFLRSLRLAVDFTDIEKRNRIMRFALDQTGLDVLQQLDPGRITREAASEGGPPGRITAVDLTDVNAPSQHVQTYDIEMRYGFDTPHMGQFRVSTDVTLLKKNETRLSPGGGAVMNALDVGSDLAGVEGEGNLKRRAYSKIEWTSGEATVGWMARYFSSYCTVSNCPPGAQRIPSQLYQDLLVGWRGREGALTGWSFQLRVGNVLNKPPPRDLTSGAYSALGDPRMRSYFVTASLQED
jgi:outer membrane receptor protein involved in Fe transport